MTEEKILLDLRTLQKRECNAKWQRNFRMKHPNYCRKYNETVRHKEVSRLSSKRRREKLRHVALEVYSGRNGIECACCGEKEYDFMVIDHINGNGSKQVNSLGGSFAFLRWLEKNNYPAGFQVYCTNCNWGKHVRGICPHQLKKARLTN